MFLRRFVPLYQHRGKNSRSVKKLHTRVDDGTINVDLSNRVVLYKLQYRKYNPTKVSHGISKVRLEGSKELMLSSGSEDESIKDEPGSKTPKHATKPHAITTGNNLRPTSEVGPSTKKCRSKLPTLTMCYERT
ncbi:PREDICTED: uncharacterized protein LOC104777146 [Camelina sativa]|uniref:Uncharacterized protein LOC104777146 n=1 Tax=Camelina sativa TaxID=90675 RepID=A0ABM0YEB0_CAMSA|nr:PREDICTED: uncharacterized protein LOC104777146 [Camelina sativa]